MPDEIGVAKRRVVARALGDIEAVHAAHSNRRMLADPDYRRMYSKYLRHEITPGQLKDALTLSLEREKAGK